MLKLSLLSRSSSPQLNFVRTKKIMIKKNFALEYVQKMRNARRQNLGQMAPSNVYFQVLGNGAEGGPKSLFLFTSHNRYLFNCGEGTQKMSSEFTGSKSLAQLCNIFITKKSWENIGGLPGMCLSVRTTGCPDVKLHGPDGIMKIYEATKHFVILFQFGVHFHSASDGMYEDPVLRVDHVPLKPSNVQPKISPDPKYCNWNSDISSSDQTKPEIDQTVMSYILTFKGKTGKMNMEKCRALGLKPGPIIGLLKKGQVVTLEDGREIHPHEVQEPDEAENEYLVIDIPSQDYLDPLLAEPKLKAENLSRIQGIFHFSPLQVVQDDKYSTWMNTFSSEIKHVMMNEASEGYGTVDGLRFNTQVNTVFPEVYKKILASEPGKSCDYSNIKSDNVIQAKTNMKIHVRPFEKEVRDPLGFNENEIEFTDEFKVELVNSQEQVKIALENHQSEPEFPKVTFLGTGSSVPNKYRNVSSILIESIENSYVILDCGEGSLLQLHRHFGRQKTLEILRQLKGIYISHLHADHHLGLIHLVLEREKAFKDIQKEPTKMYVLAPARIANYLQVYHRHFEPILTNLHFIRNEHMLIENNVENPQLYPEVQAELLEYLNMKSIKTCRAFHCPGAYCVSMVTSEGFKFVYSGDTRPVDAIIELGNEGQPTDLLIHEATMGHYMLDDAKNKRHTTFTEAINVAQDMNCRKALFTHFSQRYSKIPLYEEFQVDEAKNTAVVMDHTSVSMRTLNAISETYSALESLFGLEIDEMGERKDNFKLNHFKSPFDADEKFDDETNENQAKKRSRNANVSKRPKLIDYGD